MHALRMKKITTLLPEIACIAGAIIFTIVYIAAEQKIYHGDFRVYYSLYKFVARSFFEDWPSGLIDLLFGISNDDYNAVAVIPLLPIQWLFGDDRTCYVIGVILFYLTPATFIATRLTRADGDATQHKNLAIFFAAFLFPVFWMSTLRRMIDIAGLVPLGLAALLLQKTDFLTKANWKEAASFGLLLWCAFLLRRWYAFSILALVITSLIFILIRTLWQRRPLTKIGPVILLNYGLAGVTAILAVYNVQTQLVKRILSTSYSNIYDAFQRDAVAQIQIYYDHLGLTIVTFALVGLIVAAFQRRIQPCFFAFVAILAGILFSRVQAPERHHILPVALFLFPAYFTGLSFIAKRLMAPPVGNAMMGIVACMNFVSTFAPFDWGLAEPLRIAAPRVNYAPLHLENYDEYKRLAIDLRNLGPKTKISVYAASYMLTYDMLGSIEPAVAQSIPIFPTVDLRDGFWWHTLANEYAVIGDPTPLGDLRPGSQRVIEYPAQSIRAGTGIGAAFIDMGKVYQLDNGVKGYLYKRIRPVTAAEISDLANRFYKDYPDWRDKKTGDVGFGMASAFIESGDIKGQVEKVAPTAIIIRPGETQSTSVTFRLDEWFRPRKFTIDIVDKEGRRCSDEERLSFEFSTDAVEASSHVVAGRRPVTMEVPPGGHLKITAPPKSNSNCTTAFIIFGFNEDGK